MNLRRRHFLMGSGLAAHSAFSQTAGERIPTAMIGTGNRGSYVLKGVLEQPGAKVAALCDLKPARLDAAATVAAKDNPATYTEWRKIIDRKDIDAVFIATPPHLHSEMAVAALQAGKHVYCEKPIGITPEQVRNVVKAARSANRVFVAGQQMRSFRQLAQAVSKIREGIIGEVLMVKAQRHGSADIPHDSSSSDWYFDVSKSGGYLIEMSVHNLDACNWAIGAVRNVRQDSAAFNSIRTILPAGPSSTAAFYRMTTRMASRCPSLRVSFIQGRCRMETSTFTCSAPKALSTSCPPLQCIRWGPEEK